MREIYSPSVTMGYDISLLSIVTFSNFKSRVEKYRNTPVAKGESIVIFLIESYMWFMLSYIVYWLSDFESCKWNFEQNKTCHGKGKKRPE